MKTPQKNPINRVVDQARSASPFIEHFTPGIDEPRRIAVHPAAAATLELGRSMEIPGDLAYLLGLATPQVDHDHTFDLPAATTVPPGETVAVDPLQVVHENSVCARAGARIIIATAPPTEVREGMIVLYDQPALVRNVDPAPFALVADGADAPVSAIPVADALFDWKSVPSYGFRVTISRAQHRAVGGDGLRDATMIAVMRGLGELADRLFLQAIIAASPASFSLGAAAARHARFDELRALVGTAGTAGAVGPDGSFRAAGILAELTSAVADTVVGRFERAAIAFRPELAVHGRRMNADGDVELTVFANAQAVVPNVGDFWRVAA